MLDLNLPIHPKIHKVEHFLKQLLAKYKVETVLLFGSLAKGTSNYRSDADLLIVSDDMGTDWFERHQNAFLLSIGFVQPFVMSTNEFVSAIENRQTIIWEALADGLLLIDHGRGKEQMDRLQELIRNGSLKRLARGWQISNDDI
jgi:predicted nucleotidyltransferase